MNDDTPLPIVDDEDDESEDLFECEAYQEGMEAGLQCYSYSSQPCHEGLWSCPYVGIDADNWKSGFVNGYALRQLR